MPTLSPRNNLEQLKDAKLVTLESAVREKIVGGFVSDALGSDHYYPTKESDQLTLIGAAGTGQTLTFPCVPVTDDPTIYANWIAPEHTHEQLLQVQVEGAAFIQTQKIEYRSKVSDVYAATSEVELAAISEDF